MSFLPKIRFLGKTAQNKIFQLTFQVTSKFILPALASNIKFCPPEADLPLHDIRKPIRQQTHQILPFATGDF